MKYLLTLIMAFILVFGNAQSLKLMTYNIRLDIEVDGENNWTHRKDFCASQIQFVSFFKKTFLFKYHLCFWKYFWR